MLQPVLPDSLWQVHNKSTREIIALADAIQRTPSAVAMKLSNFASFDPAQKKRNVKGLANASNLDRAIWEEFEATPNKVAEESEEEFNRLSLPVGAPARTRDPFAPEDRLKGI